ncbi:MAG: nitrogen fixation protein NifQ [Gammaproteobacteria bacterium]|nr:nitrogen fixation protein NifQ [Gammaproteobacteria bacterium]
MTEGRSQVQEIYDRLIQNSHGLRNDHLLASMLASQLAGVGAMPSRLGLMPDAYEVMMQLHFSGAELPHSYMADMTMETDRLPEQDELRMLLLSHRNDPSAEGEWMAQIVVMGCMGGDHLWQDLGLWSRKDLSQLMQENFTALAAKNDRDMKWKKFLYKQLCIAEGIYVCRSPSCEVCPDYAACFGPED